MASFKSSCLATLEHEGGYANNPNDHGQETYMGISRRWFPDWEGWGEIDRIKARRPIRMGETNLVDVNLVFPVYRKHFWDAIAGDKLPDQNIADQVFDHAVTSGPADAIKLLQKVFVVDMDGVIGPNTLRALVEIKDYRKARKHYFNERIFAYTREAAKDFKQRDNLASWIKRSVKAYYGEI